MIFIYYLQVRKMNAITMDREKEITVVKKKLAAMENLNRYYKVCNPKLNFARWFVLRIKQIIATTPATQKNVSKVDQT